MTYSIVETIDEDGFSITETTYDSVLHLDILEMFQDHFTYRKLKYYSKEMCDTSKVIVERTIKYNIEYFHIQIGNDLVLDIEWNVNMRLQLRNLLNEYEALERNEMERDSSLYEEQQQIETRNIVIRGISNELNELIDLIC
jgi:hypothetical protein